MSVDLMTGRPLLWVVKRSYYDDGFSVRTCIVESLISRAIRIIDGDVRRFVLYKHGIHVIHGKEDFVFLQAKGKIGRIGKKEFTFLASGGEHVGALTPYQFIYTDDFLVNKIYQQRI